MDLDEWAQDGRVVALLDLIEQMPSTAHWRAAQQQDPEYIRAAVQARLEELGQERAQDPGDDADVDEDDEAEDVGWRPPQTTWTTDTSALAQLVTLTASVAGALGVDVPPEARTFPGPRDIVGEVVAMAEREQELQQERDALAQLGYSPEVIAAFG